MSGPAITATALPTGGAVLLSFYGAHEGRFAPPSGATTMTLQRAVSGVSGLGAFEQLYSGAPVPLWIDVNDGPGFESTPLVASTSYVWQATDIYGTTQVGPVVPASSIVTVPDGLTQVLIRLLQAAVDNAPKPSGVSVTPVQVTTKMPAGGWQAMPFIVVNLDLFQQNDVAVGQDVLVAQDDNQWTLPGWARRVWRISVLSPDADERDFYRDTLLIAFRALKATFFSQVGQNIRHSYQASSGTTFDEFHGQAPGFYWADVMFDLEGVFDVTLMTGYGAITKAQMVVQASHQVGLTAADMAETPSPNVTVGITIEVVGTGSSAQLIDSDGNPMFDSDGNPMFGTI